MFCKHELFKIHVGVLLPERDWTENSTPVTYDYGNQSCWTLIVVAQGLVSFEMF